MLDYLLLAAASTASAPVAASPSTIAAIEAVCYENIDAQMEADADRVRRTIHPEMVSRAVGGRNSSHALELETETVEELLELTRKGVLKTPKEKWDRNCKVLDVAGNAAVVRLETPWFVSFDEMGNFDGKWLIVNSFWYSKPQR